MTSAFSQYNMLQLKVIELYGARQNFEVAIEIKAYRKKGSNLM